MASWFTTIPGAAQPMEAREGFAGNASYPISEEPQERERMSQMAVWQQRAQAAYQQAEADTISRIQREFARRIALLIDYEPQPQSIYVNLASGTATARVDSITFRLHGNDLTIIRPCAGCGLGQFESLVITSLEDLGGVLTMWQPRCPQCPEEDPNDWFDDLD